MNVRADILPHRKNVFHNRPQNFFRVVFCIAFIVLYLFFGVSSVMAVENLSTSGNIDSTDEPWYCTDDSQSQCLYYERKVLWIGTVGDITLDLSGFTKDLDLWLWYDNDNDPTFQNRVATSTKAELNAEKITYTNAAPGWYIVWITNGDLVSKSDSTGYSLSGSFQTDETAPSAPTWKTNATVPGDGEVTLNWNANAEEDLYGYFVYQSDRSTQSEQGGINPTDETTYDVAYFVNKSDGTSYTVSGLTNGKIYYFAVTAIDADNCYYITDGSVNTYCAEDFQNFKDNESGSSGEKSAIPQLPPPSGITAVPGDGTVTLNWNLVGGSVSYKYNIYQASTSGVKKNNYSKNYSNVEPPYTISGLTNESFYYFVVTTVNSAGEESSESSEVVAKPTATPTPNNPPVISSGPTVVGRSCIALGESTTVSVSASDQDGEPLSYAWSVSSGTISGTGSSVTYTAPTTGETSIYPVVTVTVSDGRGGSDTEGKNILIVRKQYPTGISAITGNLSVIVSWNTVSGATGYRVYDSSSPSYFSGNGMVATAPPFTLNNLTAGITHYFTVTATYSGNEESCLSPEVVSATPFQNNRPVVSITGMETTSTGGRKFKWVGNDIDNHALTYRYSIYKAGALSKNYIPIGSTEVTTPSLSDGTYIFEVIANDGLEDSEPSAIPFVVSPVLPPDSVTVSPGSQQVSLIWSPSPSPNIVKYNIYRVSTASTATTEPSSWGDILTSVSVSSTAPTYSYTDSTVTNGIKYWYVITSVNSAGTESLKSAPAVWAIPREIELAIYKIDPAEIDFDNENKKEAQIHFCAEAPQAGGAKQYSASWEVNMELRPLDQPQAVTKTFGGVKLAVQPEKPGTYDGVTLWNGGTDAGDFAEPGKYLVCLKGKVTFRNPDETLTVKDFPECISIVQTGTCEPTTSTSGTAAKAFKASGTFSIPIINIKEPQVLIEISNKLFDKDLFVVKNQTFDITAKVTKGNKFVDHVTFTLTKDNQVVKQVDVANPFPNVSEASYILNNVQLSAPGIYQLLAVPYSKSGKVFTLELVNEKITVNANARVIAIWFEPSFRNKDGDEWSQYNNVTENKKPFQVFRKLGRLTVDYGESKPTLFVNSVEIVFAISPKTQIGSTFSWSLPEGIADIKREVQTGIWRCTSFSNDSCVFYKGVPWPTNDDTGGDNKNTDEALSPNNPDNSIYAVDAPALDSFADAYNGYKKIIYKLRAEEWVQCTIDGKKYNCSNRFPWYSVVSVKRTDEQILSVYGDYRWIFTRDSDQVYKSEGNQTLTIGDNP